MIIVTGATGALNGATVDHLLERMPASEIVVVTRDPAPTPVHCRLRSGVPTNCCWSPRTIPAPTW